MKLLVLGSGFAVRHLDSHRSVSIVTLLIVAIISLRPDSIRLSSDRDGPRKLEVATGMP